MGQPRRVSRYCCRTRRQRVRSCPPPPSLAAEPSLFLVVLQPYLSGCNGAMSQYPSSLSPAMSNRTLSPLRAEKVRFLLFPPPPHTSSRTVKQFFRRFDGDIFSPVLDMGHSAPFGALSIEIWLECDAGTLIFHGVIATRSFLLPPWRFRQYRFPRQLYRVGLTFRMRSRPRSLSPPLGSPFLRL